MTTKLNAQVKEFHKLVGQPIGSAPAVPDEKWVRLRGRLVIEEAFEFLESLGPKYGHSAVVLRYAKDMIKGIVSEMLIEVDLPAAVDALADLDYVVEGSRVAFGVDGDPIADEVHRANMTKVAGGLDEHGKAKKPVGWKLPQVAKELELQGWDGQGWRSQ